MNARTCRKDIVLAVAGFHPCAGSQHPQLIAAPVNVVGAVLLKCMRRLTRPSAILGFK
jgi:hypothetical protein